MLGAILGAAMMVGTSLVPSWSVDAPALAWIAAASGGALALERSDRRDPCPCDPAGLFGFDRVSLGRSDRAGARASDVLQYGSVVAAPLFALVTDPGSNEDRALSALIAIEAMSVAGSTTQLLKMATHRPRPAAYGADARPPFSYESFPSGHTTGAFAAAASATTLFALRHPHSRATPWIAAAGFAVAASTGFLRVESGRHFPSDVVAGAAIGAAAGVGIPLLHARAQSVALTPGGIVARF